MRNGKQVKPNEFCCPVCGFQFNSQFVNNVNKTKEFLNKSTKWPDEEKIKLEIDEALNKYSNCKHDHNSSDENKERKDNCSSIEIVVQSSKHYLKYLENQV